MALLKNLGVISSHVAQNGSVSPIFRSIRNVHYRCLKASITGAPGVMNFATSSKARIILPVWNGCCKSRILSMQSKENNVDQNKNVGSRWLCSERLAGSYSRKQEGSYYGKLLGVGLLIALGMKQTLLADEPTKAVVAEGAKAGESAGAPVNVAAGGVPKIADVAEARRADQHGSNLLQNTDIDQRSEEMLCLDTINDFDFEDFITSFSVFWALVSEDKLEEDVIYEEGKMLFNFQDSFFDKLGFPSLIPRSELDVADAESVFSATELAQLRRYAESAMNESLHTFMQACLQRMQILLEYKEELEVQVKRLEKLKDLPPATWTRLFKGYILVHDVHQAADKKSAERRDRLHQKEIMMRPMLMGAFESLAQMSDVCASLGLDEAVDAAVEDADAWKIITLDITNEIEILKNRIVQLMVLVYQRKMEYELQEDEKALATESVWDRLLNWRQRRLLAKRYLLQKTVERKQQQLLESLSKALLQRKEELWKELKLRGEGTQKFMKKSEDMLEERKRLLAFKEKAEFALKAREEKEREEAATTKPAGTKGEEIDEEQLRWGRFNYTVRSQN